MEQVLVKFSENKEFRKRNIIWFLSRNKTRISSPSTFKLKPLPGREVLHYYMPYFYIKYKFHSFVSMHTCQKQNEKWRMVIRSSFWQINQQNRDLQVSRQFLSQLKIEFYNRWFIKELLGVEWGTENSSGQKL